MLLVPGSVSFSLERLALKQSCLLNVSIRRQFKTIYQLGSGKKLLDRLRKARELDKFKRRIITVPNILTFSRLAITPLFPLLVLNGHTQYAFGLLVYCGLSDMLDGWIARKFNQKSALGSVLDPLADKMTVLIFASTLVWTGKIPVYLCALFVSKDLVLLASGVVLRFKILRKLGKSIWNFFNPSVASVEIKPLLLSKLNTALQFVVLGTSVAPFSVPEPWGSAIQIISGISTLSTGLLHIFQYRQVVRQLQSHL